MQAPFHSAYTKKLLEKWGRCVTRRRRAAAAETLRCGWPPAGHTQHVVVHAVNHDDRVLCAVVHVVFCVEVFKERLRHVAAELVLLGLDVQ
jgi:hypothetical protein